MINFHVPSTTKDLIRGFRSRSCITPSVRPIHLCQWCCMQHRLHPGKLLPSVNSVNTQLGATDICATRT